MAAKKSLNSGIDLDSYDSGNTEVWKPNEHSRLCSDYFICLSCVITKKKFA